MTENLPDTNVGDMISNKFILTILIALACPLLLPVVIEDKAEEES